MLAGVETAMIWNDTFPIKADDPPRRAMPTATLAGAPPGAFLKAGDSASESPLIVGTKSISISPKQTIRGDSLVSGTPSENALTSMYQSYQGSANSTTCRSQM